MKYQCAATAFEGLALGSPFLSLSLAEFFPGLNKCIYLCPREFAVKLLKIKGLPPRVSLPDDFVLSGDSFLIMSGVTAWLLSLNNVTSSFSISYI